MEQGGLTVANEERTQDYVMEPCPPCAGTGEFPPEQDEPCPWCGGEGELVADLADQLIEARRSYQAKRGR